MTALTALFGSVVAVLPLEKRHLFRQPPDRLSSRTERRREQGMAGRAHFGLPDVHPLGWHHSGCRIHDACLSTLDLERTEHRSLFERRRAVDDVTASETFRRAEPFGPNLMADGARHAIGGQQVDVVP